MKKDYQSGIDILKQFMDKVYKISNNKKDNTEEDLLFYVSNYYEILFYLSKSYLNDNFADLVEQIDENLVKDVFTGNITKNNFYKDCFIHDNEQIIEELIKNQYFQLPSTMLNNISETFRLIRNYLAHFNYIIMNNMVIIDLKEKDIKKYNINTISFSIESLTILILATLSNQGQSYSKDAYDYYTLAFYENFSNKINIEHSVILKISNNSNNNKYTPLNITKYITNQNITQLDDVINITKILGKYKITKIDFDRNIINKLDYELLNINNSQNFINLYMSCFDDKRRATISYKFALGILYLLVNGREEEIYSIYKNYFKIINNTLFICYMSLVFDDYSIEKNGVVNESLFKELNFYRKNENIPRKFRNSLAHARYRFDDILDDSKGIIIEFWDEKDKVINFKCKITKENALLLIDKYVESLI